MNWLRRKLGFVKITIDGRVHYYWRYGKYRKLFTYLFTTYGPSKTTGNIRATEICCNSDSGMREKRSGESIQSRQHYPTTIIGSAGETR